MRTSVKRWTVKDASGKKHQIRATTRKEAQAKFDRLHHRPDIPRYGRRPMIAHTNEGVAAIASAPRVIEVNFSPYPPAPAEGIAAVAQRPTAIQRPLHVDLRVHVLKSWPEYFERLAGDSNNFELRRADREFQVNDYVVFREFDPRLGKYTGRRATVRITKVSTGYGGVVPDHVALMLTFAGFRTIEAIERGLPQLRDENTAND